MSSPSAADAVPPRARRSSRSEEHTSELQSHSELVCRLLLEKKKTGAPAEPGTPQRAPRGTRTKSTPREAVDRCATRPRKHPQARITHTTTHTIYLDMYLRK